MDIKKLIADAGVIGTDLAQTVLDVETLLVDAGVLTSLTAEKLLAAGPAPADTLITIKTATATHTIVANKYTGKIAGGVLDAQPAADGAINPANWAAFLAFLEQLLPYILPLI